MEKEEEEGIDDEVIVRGIPKTMKARALALLERLKANPKSISWDSTGQVKLDGTLIPKSNISDLVSDAMRSRKSFNPVGVHEFFKILNDINVPRDLVRNEERWKDVDKPYKWAVPSLPPSINESTVTMKWGKINQKGGFVKDIRKLFEEIAKKKKGEKKRKNKGKKKKKEKGGRIMNAWVTK